MLGLDSAKNMKKKHQNVMTKLILEVEDSQQKMLPERFIIDNKEGIELSKRVMNMNGLLVNNYEDKFLPQIRSWIDPNDEDTMIIKIDLLGAKNSTTVFVDPDTVTIEGERSCSEEYISEQDLIINTSNCGKFMMNVDKPQDHFFNPIDDIVIANMTSRDGFCVDGSCIVYIKMKQPSHRNRKEDL